MNSNLRNTAENMSNLGGTRATSSHPWWAVGAALLAVLDEYPEVEAIAQETYEQRTKEK